MLYSFSSLIIPCTSAIKLQSINFYSNTKKLEESHFFLAQLPWYPPLYGFSDPFSTMHDGSFMNVRYLSFKDTSTSNHVSDVKSEKVGSPSHSYIRVLVKNTT